MSADLAFQRCIRPACAATFGVDEVHVACPRCGGLLDVAYDWDRAPVPKTLRAFDARRGANSAFGAGRLDFSGVWRFRELLPFWRDERNIASIGEGRTLLQQADLVARDVGMNPGRLFLQYEGFNPSGSFKDNGMTAAFTHAGMVGARRVACASTGNTSASLALYAALLGLQAVVFVGSGKIAFGKLSQALDYGALTLQVKGDFDQCLARVREVATDVPELGVYLMNSVNPFRLEGQKTIMLRVLEGLGWEVPDWIVVPGGNLGNCSAFGKAFSELKALGLVDRVPRLAVINAAGADTLHHTFDLNGVRWNGGAVECDEHGCRPGYKAKTVASAIEIGKPVNLPKALRALDAMDGVVRRVDDDQILDARAAVARWGYGCEPASAASVAGLRALLADGTVSPSDRVVCVLTGHELKDPDATVEYHTGIDTKGAQEKATRRAPHGRLANRPVQVDDDLASIVAALREGPPPTVLA